MVSLFDSRLKYVTCKIWDATEPGFDYPEWSDPELAYDALRGRADLGLTFSGGGTRAASAALGQLRGLSALGLLGKARYISCVSGGSFASTAFSYLPSSWNDKTFLGAIVPPGDITVDHLRRTDRNSFAHAIANASLVDEYFKNAIRLAGDETYSRAIGDVFLYPFNLDSLQRFFTLDGNTLAAILTHNPRMRASDFYLLRSGRPFLIVNALFLRPVDGQAVPPMIPLETTPLYVGTRQLHKGAGSNGRDIGGGFIEPFGFDSDEPDDGPDASGRVRVRLGASRHRYTLSDAIGSSGAAPARGLAEAGLPFFGFPELKHWPLTGVGETSAREYEIGDGGNLENLGLMPLLARRVKNIIVFTNTRDELVGDGPGEINDSIRPHFGQTQDFATNNVFLPSAYGRLVDGLMTAKREGRTVMFKDRYEVQENLFWGIQGGWEVNILWVYNERVPAWEQELPARIRRMIGVGSLGNFPHYKTMFQNPPAAIDLSAKQTFMLAHLSSWNVISNEEMFQSMLA